MASRGKQYREKRTAIDRATRFGLDEGFALLKQSGYAKFNESVDVAINLGVNPKYSDQMVRGAVNLPHGTGKTVRVLVFAKGEKEQEARDAGADMAGGEELVERIQKEGMLDFDVAIATPDMMRFVGKIGKLLGPRGLMPNPKSGSVTTDVAKAVREARAGRVEFRVDKAGIVHCPVGKLSFPVESLKENFLAVVESLRKLKPATSKGIYFQKMSVSSTMGPGVKLDANEVLSHLK